MWMCIVANFEGCNQNQHRMCDFLVIFHLAVSYTHSVQLKRHCLYNSHIERMAKSSIQKANTKIPNKCHPITANTNDFYEAFWSEISFCQPYSLSYQSCIKQTNKRTQKRHTGISAHILNEKEAPDKKEKRWEMNACLREEIFMYTRKTLNK